MPSSQGWSVSCSHDCLCGCLFEKGCDGYKFTCPPLKCLFGKVSLARRYLVRAQCVVLGFLGLFGLVNFFNVQIAWYISHLSISGKNQRIVQYMIHLKIFGKLRFLGKFSLLSWQKIQIFLHSLLNGDKILPFFINNGNIHPRFLDPPSPPHFGAKLQNIYICNFSRWNSTMLSNTALLLQPVWCMHSVWRAPIALFIILWTLFLTDSGKQTLILCIKVCNWGQYSSLKGIKV